MTLTIRLLRDYVVIAIAAFLGAAMMARVGHWAQHKWAYQYLLMPVNLPSLYFVPLFVGGIVWAGRNYPRVKGSTRALVLALMYTAARLLYWWYVARDLVAKSSIDFDMGVAIQSPWFWVGSLLGPAACVAVGVTMVRTFNATRGVAPTTDIV
jgi:hypothetical protein